MNLILITLKKKFQFDKTHDNNVIRDRFFDLNSGNPVITKAENAEKGVEILISIKKSLPNCDLIK